MKKLLALSIMGGLSLSAVAQEPEMKSRSLVVKFTETWCGPCGDWGWELAEDVIADLGDKGYYIGVMGSSSPSTMNANCYSAFESNFLLTGYPTFFVNDTDGDYYFSTVSPLYNAFYTTEPVASSAGTASISGSTISVNTKTKFWTGASGEYSIAAFVIEDKVMAAQASQPGVVPHHNLMRGTMMPDNSPWGQNLVAGDVAAGAEFTKSFSMTIPSDWVKENLSVMMVIYKKEAGKYKFVNAMKAAGGTTSLESIKSVGNFNLYPNPVNGAEAQVSIDLTEATKLGLVVTDFTGRQVYAIDSKQYLQGAHTLTIPTNTFASGIYSVSLRSDKGVVNKTMVVTK